MSDVRDFLTLLEECSPRPLSVPEMARMLELRRWDRRSVEAALQEAVLARRARRIGKTRWQWLATAPGVARAARIDPVEGLQVERRGGPRGAAAARTARPPRRLVTGRFVATRSGLAFVTDLVGKPLAGDVKIAEEERGDALHGDVVEAEITRLDRRTGRAAGRVISVKQHANDRVVGTLEPTRSRRTARPGGIAPAGGSWLLLPLTPRLPPVEIVPGRPDAPETAGGPAEAVAGQGSSSADGTAREGFPPADGTAREATRPAGSPSGAASPVIGAADAGKLALVRVTRWPSALRGPAGVLERILGEPEDPEAQFLTIALEHGLRIEFPAEVLAEARQLPPDPTPAEIAEGDDLRPLPFVTIDGETAKDFDDAVQIERHGAVGYRLRVAIADVARHVRPGSAIDLEARLRGTSVYFPDRAIPMLPEALSSGLCSLLPGRDRQVVFAELDLDARGILIDRRFARGTIRSRARLTYTRVAAVLSQADTREIRGWREEIESASPGLLGDLALMHELMRKLLARRIAAGSLDLDLPEAMIDLSDEGRTVGVRLAPRNDAHRMIEEFMLLANVAVASALTESEVPLPYRIHEQPDLAKLRELNALLDDFGIQVELPEGRAPIAPRAIQKVVERLADHRLGRVLQRQVLRALAQARYSTENVGHFGLAFPTYCHFTSPIRRYPDLLVHRQVVAMLERDAHGARRRGPDLTAASDASSRAERVAMDAERAMIDLKKTELMLDHLLEPVPATVVSIAPFGIFVELEPYPIEGLVPLDALADDIYAPDRRAGALVGRRRKGRFRLGDRLVVEATDASLRRRQVTFRIVEGPRRGTAD